MPQQLSLALRAAVDPALLQLHALSEIVVANPMRPGKWSPKQELGHLIDSATNNHIRFARAAIAQEFAGPGYAQDEWVRIHGYQEMPWQAVVDFWYQYNSFLAGLVERIPEDRLHTK